VDNTAPFRTEAKADEFSEMHILNEAGVFCKIIDSGLVDDYPPHGLHDFFFGPFSFKTVWSVKRSVLGELTCMRVPVAKLTFQRPC